MKNFVQKGNVMDYLNDTAGAITSGSFVVGNGCHGIAVTNIAIGDTGSINLEGVYTLTKAANVNPLQGATVYWDTSASRITDIPSATTKFAGFCWLQPGGASATIDVLIVQAPITVGVHIAQNTTANATDLPSAIALVNSLKATVNSLTTSLQNGGALSAT